MTRLPVVSVLLMTYNHERFVVEALESVLAQEYPRELLDVVLVDDGSTDRTWELVQPYADRIRAITKPNGGVRSTAQRCVAEARGELVCFMSCDDVMHPHRVRAGVDVLLGHPEVALACGDADRIDAHGARESGFLEVCPAPLPDQRGALLTRQPICAPTAMYRRAQLVPHMPVREPCPWEDWWIYPHLMDQGLLWCDAEPLVRYRRHEQNLYNGSTWEKALRLRLLELPWMRHLLTRTDHEGIPSGELMAAAVNVVDAVVQIEREGIAAPEESAPVSDEDRRAGGEELARAIERLGADDPDGAVRAMARAVGHDPRSEGMRPVFTEAEAQRRARAAATPVPLRGNAITARWGEVRRRPWLLEAYAEAFGADDDVTLALHADGWSAQSLQAELFPLAQEAGLDDDGPDVVVITHGNPRDYEAPVVTGAVAALTDDAFVAAWAGAPRAGDPDALRRACAGALKTRA